MTSAVDRIHDHLARSHHRSNVVLTGNATSALTLLLEVAGTAGGIVAIPNNVCYSVPQAVLYADATPRYLDVTTTDVGLDPDHLRAHIGEVDAVIAVHAYGTPCRIHEIAEICREHGVFLIEDLAVAQGATLATGEPTGSVGDAAVVSFGAGKIIDIGHGGAVLTDDHALAARVAERVAALPPFRPSMETVSDHLSSFHTKLYNRSYVSGLGPNVQTFLSRLQAARDAFFYRFDQGVADRLEMELRYLPENVARRRNGDRNIRALITRRGLPGITVSPPPEGAVPWRCNLFVEPQRSVLAEGERPAAVRRGALLRHLLDRDYRVSSWQPSVDLFFREREELELVRDAVSPATVAPPKTPVSDRIGDTILNLWVNDDVDDAYATAVVDEITAWVTHTWKYRRIRRQ